MGIEMMLERIMGAMEKQVREFHCRLMVGIAARLASGNRGPSVRCICRDSSEANTEIRTKRWPSCEGNAQNFDRPTRAWRLCSRAWQYVVLPPFPLRKQLQFTLFLESCLILTMTATARTQSQPYRPFRRHVSQPRPRESPITFPASPPFNCPVRAFAGPHHIAVSRDSHPLALFYAARDPRLLRCDPRRRCWYPPLASFPREPPQIPP
jgi:hypothetical protein